MTRKRSTDQPDLFDWQPPSKPNGSVVRLPASRWGPTVWRRKVAPIALTLESRKTEVGRENAWERMIQTVARQLSTRGATDDEVDAELRKFRKAVIEEMFRLQTHQG